MLRKILHGLVEQQSEFTFAVARHHLVTACQRLQKAGYRHLSLVTAVDWQDRWEVVYHLVDYGKSHVVTLRVTTPYHDPRVPSVTSIWPGAGWHERETYDLMGIHFEGNVDLRRILLPQDYDEHPLRKEVLHGNRS